MSKYLKIAGLTLVVLSLLVITPVKAKAVTLDDLNAKLGSLSGEIFALKMHLPAAAATALPANLPKLPEMPKLPGLPTANAAGMPTLPTGLNLPTNQPVTGLYTGEQDPNYGKGKTTTVTVQKLLQDRTNQFKKDLQVKTTGDQFTVPARTVTLTNMKTCLQVMYNNIWYWVSCK
jgi:hypothetical protein